LVNSNDFIRYGAFIDPNPEGGETIEMVPMTRSVNPDLKVGENERSFARASKAYRTLIMNP
jgi:hypothetical protein